MTELLEIKQIQQEARVPVIVFALTGEMDANTCGQFQEEALQAVETGASYVVLDLSKLRYISSAGLRALFTLAKALSSKGGTVTGGNGNAGIFKSPYLKLYNPQPNVRQALDLMGFTMSMEIYNDLDQALASF